MNVAEFANLALIKFGAIERVTPQKTRYGRPLILKRKVKKLLTAQNGKCWLCGYYLGDDISIEHHIPKSFKGNNDIDNLRLCHSVCNRVLGNATPTEKIAFKEALSVYQMSIHRQIKKAGNWYQLPAKRTRSIT